MIFFTFHSVIIIHSSCSKCLHFIPFLFLNIFINYTYTVFLCVCQLLDYGSCVSPQNYSQCVYAIISCLYFDKLLKLSLIRNIWVLYFLLVRAMNASCLYFLLTLRKLKQQYKLGQWFCVVSGTGQSWKLKYRELCFPK